MHRIEFKVREINRPWLEQTLAQYGAAKVFEGEITDIYYEHKDGSFLKSGKRVTVRMKGDKHRLSFKNKYNDIGVGVVDEWEVEVSDGHMMDKIMIGLGFTHFKVFKKYRVDYKHGDVIISFDKYKGELEHIPEFMMLEGSAEEQIYEWAERLGYTQDQLEALSVLDLIEAYSDKAAG